jgi:signal transduction histidine kinase
MTHPFHRLADRAGRSTPLAVERQTTELLNALHLIVGLDQLLGTLCIRFLEIAGARAASIFLYEPITDRYTKRDQRGTPRPDAAAEHPLTSAERLVKWLSVNQTPLAVKTQQEVVRFLSVQEREYLSSHGIELVVPFLSVNRLTGMLFLTEKTSGGEYTPADRDLLDFLASQSALALDNAVMTQFQEDRLKRLFRADKLATVGELAAGAAHEIRNPLTSIRSTIQYLGKYLPYVREVIEEVDRIDSIIHGLLSLSRSTDLDLKEIDLDDLVQQTIVLLDTELRKRSIEVVRHTVLPDARIEADPAQIKQVFLNVLLNSIQAMDRGGVIRVELTQSPGLPGEPGMVRATIDDEGGGIRPEVLQKAFDPFFTTKDDGTGLGLSISYGIVGRHGGEIDIESRTDAAPRGTRVTITLPRVHHHS